LGNNIYHHNEDGIFVNLFVASEVKWGEKGITLRQETKFPEQQRTTLIAKTRRPIEFSLFIRIPSWTSKKFRLTVNGRKLAAVPAPSGYVDVRRLWRNGDKVEVFLPMELKLSHLPDDPSVAAILFGPVVLAGALGNEAMTKEMERGLGSSDVDRMISQGAAIETPSLVVPDADLNTWIKPVRGKPLTFRTVNVGKPHDVTLIPFYRTFGQRYAIYWNAYAPYEWKVIQDSRQVFPSGTLDRVIVGDQQSEREHNFQAWRFQTGERDGRKWVKSPQSFRYDLNVDPDQVNTLACTFWAGDKDCNFDILIDGLRMTSQTLTGGKEDEFVEMKYQIPADLVQGKKRVAVIFRAKGGKTTGELYACAIVKTTE
jgi:hypothetical protein